MKSQRGKNLGHSDLDEFKQTKVQYCLSVLSRNNGLRSEEKGIYANHIWSMFSLYFSEEVLLVGKISGGVRGGLSRKLWKRLVVFLLKLIGD